MLRRRFLGTLLISALVLPTAALAQSAQANPTAPVKKSEVYRAPDDVIAKIREEGLNKSKIM